MKVKLHVYFGSEHHNVIRIGIRQLRGIYETQIFACNLLLALRIANGSCLRSGLSARIILRMASFRLRRSGEALFLALWLCQPIALVSAAPGDNAQAMADYQNKRYLQALREFQVACQNSPNDASCHYYLGLCYQSTNQLAPAVTQFQWVILYGRDPNLKTEARLGLEQIDRLREAGNLANTALNSAKSSPTPQAVSASATVKSDEPKFVHGRMKVIEFKTKWCHVCKSFDPVFEETRRNSKYTANCDFKRLDAEEEANFELVQKYSITRFPTIICADSSGKQIFRFSGGTDAAGLARMLDRSLARIPD